MGISSYFSLKGYVKQMAKDYVKQMAKDLVYYEIFPEVPLYRLMNKVALFVGGSYVFLGAVMGDTFKTFSGSLLFVVGGTNEYLASSFSELKKTEKVTEDLKETLSEEKDITKMANQAADRLSEVVSKSEPLLRNAESAKRLKKLREQRSLLLGEEEALLRQIENCDDEGEKRSLDGQLKEVRQKKIQALRDLKTQSA